MPLAARESDAPDAPEAELEALKTRIQELDRELEQSQGERDNLQSELEKTEKAIAAAAAASREASADLDSQRQRVDEARRERETAARRLEEARTRLGRGLRALYMADAPTRLQALFQADRLSAIDRIEADAAAVARTLAKSVAEVRDRIAGLQSTEDALRAQVDGLEARRQTSSDALAVLRRAQQARRSAVEALSRRIGDRTAERVDAEKEQARMQKLIEKVRRAIREAPDLKYEQGVPFAEQRGKLPWPLHGTLLAEFGQPKAAGGRMKWNGWWIAAEEGTAVRAVADARVVYVGQIQRYGLVVILDHSGDYLSLYGHVQAAQASVGDTVKAGDAIAAAGSSGGHDESGVYFEIRRGTTAVDPKTWLAQ